MVLVIFKSKSKYSGMGHQPSKSPVSKGLEPIDSQPDKVYSPEEQAHLQYQFQYGAILPPERPTKPGVGYKFPVRPFIPEYTDLRQGACSPYFPAWEQGDQGTCTAQASSAAYACLQRLNKVPSDMWITPSRNYNYYWSRGGTVSSAPDGDYGSSVLAALETMKKFGVSSEMPEESRGNELPTLESMRSGARHSVLDFFPLETSLENLKLCIANGYPFIFSFVIHKSTNTWFQSRADQFDTLFVLPDPEPAEQVVGGHACLVVGYDDNMAGGVFIVRNSWGTNWGLDGHFFISYILMQDETLVREYYLVKEICPGETPAAKGTRGFCLTSCPFEWFCPFVFPNIRYEPSNQNVNK